MASGKPGTGGKLLYAFETKNVTDMKRRSVNSGDLSLYMVSLNCFTACHIGTV